MTHGLGRMMGLVVVMAWSLTVGIAPAEEAPPTATAFFGTPEAGAVLNSPGVAVEVGKAATNAVQPGLEQLYDLRGEWRTGTSAALWTYRQAEVPLVTLRAGYAIDFLPYVSAPVDIKGVTTRYVLPLVPEVLEGWLRAGPLDLAWSVIGTYGMVGPWIGWNFDREEDGNDDDGGLVGGVSLGAKVMF